MVVLALLLGLAAPPRASLYTGSARLPLAISSWCWDARCGAPLGVTGGHAFVRRGSTIRIEATADALSANVSVSGASAHATTNGREITWTARRAGGLTAYVRYSRGWVIYTGRLAFRR